MRLPEWDDHSTYSANSAATYGRDYNVGRVGMWWKGLARHPGAIKTGCLRCRTSWSFVESHCTIIRGPSRTFVGLDGTSTGYGYGWSGGGGVNILCVECWAELTPEERLPFHRVHWEQNRFYTAHLYDIAEDRRQAYLAGDDDDWRYIERAVLEGA